MDLISKCFLLLLAAQPAVCAQYFLPKLNGPHHVGKVDLELVDYRRLDPFAPTPTFRDLMVSLFYPTSDIRNYKNAPVFPPITASLGDQQYGLPPGSVESLYSRAYLNAPLSDPSLPVILFSPGFGETRGEYTAALEDLASHGYIIVALDHPYLSSVVEYPDGRVVASLGLQPPDFPGGIPTPLYVQVADGIFALNALNNRTILEQIPGLSRGTGNGRGRPCRTLQTRRVGYFGHSFGGATAAQAIVNDTRFVTGVNLDGGLYGSVATSGVKQPFFIMASEGHNRTNIDGWESFWDASTGYKRDININGTLHGSFTDMPAILDGTPLGQLVPPEVRAQFGSINGLRMLDIETTYLDAFFKLWLKRDGSGKKLLDRPSPKYPEVTFEK